MKILVTPTSFTSVNTSEGALRLKAFADEIVFNDTGKPLAGQDLIDRLQDCDGMIAGLDYITKDVLRNCSQLKVISRYGAGYDRVDLAEARKRNITVTNTPGANKEAVAELTMGLILSVARKIPYLDKAHKEGRWARSIGIELCDKTIGILGLGAIGKRVAQYAQGYDMNVICYDPYIDEEYALASNIQSVKLEELLKTSHVISLHLPLTKETKHLIDKDAVKMMQEGTIIVNTSRGEIIEEDSVLDGLKSGKLMGLGLDVYETEPPIIDKYLGFDNVVLTPHIASQTEEAKQKMLNIAVSNLIKILTGQKCENIVKYNERNVLI